eukprot:343368-Pyramimonas_sp.AAC.1
MKAEGPCGDHAFHGSSMPPVAFASISLSSNFAGPVSTADQSPHPLLLGMRFVANLSGGQ